MVIELTDMPALARGIMKRPEGEGCDEAVLLDDLHMLFLSGGQNAVWRELLYSWAMLYQIIADGLIDLTDPDADEEPK